ncbi:hypothetical protein AZE42_09227 [Rhizopogon vesiculosus]|uniref:Uncharacterized protein n=1 Tax=Rhizopogon vesiculosus TaxID=180088 RepID=A0A1J8RBJ4_9AGAM|nr:hypothetical protein AZE42_09227 [Rhizopogon vesiculosus]
MEHELLSSEASDLQELRQEEFVEEASFKKIKTPQQGQTLSLPSSEHELPVTLVKMGRGRPKKQASPNIHAPDLTQFSISLIVEVEMDPIITPRKAQILACHPGFALLTTP